MEATDNHMIHLLHYYSQSLLLFLGLLGWLSVGTLIARTKSEEKRSLRKFSEELNVDVKLASRVLLAVMGFVVSFGTGYMVREHELSTNTITYTSVSVLEKLTEKEFWIWPERMKQQHIVVCPESTVGWYVEEVLTDVTFEQRLGCKRIISYHEKPKGEVDASIQIGR